MDRSLFAAAIAAAVLISACSSGDSGSVVPTGTTPVISSVPTTPISLPPPPTSPARPTNSPAPDFSHLRLGESLPLRTPGGTFSLAVNRVLALVSPPHNPNRWVGVSVTLELETGAPVFDSTLIGVAPAYDGSSADDGTGYNDALGRRINDAACGPVPIFAGQMRAAGATHGWLGWHIANLRRRVTGCLVFTLDKSDHPATVTMYDTDPEGAKHPVGLGSWRVKFPQHVRTVTPPRITLKVFGNGSSALVTYGVGTSIGQNTGAQLPWAKQVSNAFDFYSVSAQDNDGSSITCEILDTNGRVLDKQTSSGLYAIVSCSTSY